MRYDPNGNPIDENDPYSTAYGTSLAAPNAQRTWHAPMPPGYQVLPGGAVVDANGTLVPGARWIDSGGPTIDPSTPVTPPPGAPAPGTRASDPTTANQTTGGGSAAPNPNAFDLGPLMGLPQLPSVPGAPSPNLPTFHAPDPFSYADWRAPSVAEAMNDPGYQFRLDQGQGALQRWAAAKGTLNDSGTAKALIDYGQNAGSQEYANVWNRDFSAYNTGRQNALQTYNTNYKTQNVDPYTFDYQRGMDLFAPQFAQWQAGNARDTLGYTTGADWAKHANDLSYADLWNKKNGAITLATS